MQHPQCSVACAPWLTGGECRRDDCTGLFQGKATSMVPWCAHLSLAVRTHTKGNGAPLFDVTARCACVYSKHWLLCSASNRSGHPCSVLTLSRQWSDTLRFRNSAISGRLTRRIVVDSKAQTLSELVPQELSSGTARLHGRCCRGRISMGAAAPVPVDPAAELVDPCRRAG
jgi:hypothetical protein